jgi:hypothetical protein
MEPTTGIEPVNLFLTKEALYLLSYVGTLKQLWSGRRDSNSRHSAWKAEALPTELLPQHPEWWWGEDLNLRRRMPTDLQSVPFGHSGTPPSDYTPWSQRRDSNPRPTDYKSVALPPELRWPQVNNSWPDLFIKSEDIIFMALDCQGIFSVFLFSTDK